jgi:putative nucleotidyltransferase with HDIG domain
MADAMAAPQETSESADAGVNAAKRAETEGRWGDACAAYELMIRDASVSQETRLSALRRLGRAYVEQGDWRTALDVLEAATAAAELANSPLAVAQALNVIAIAHQSAGHLDVATQQYQMARECAESIGDKGLVAMLDQNLGTVASIRGDTTAALDAFQLSLDGYRSLGMAGYQGQVLNNIGLVHMDLGDFAAAESAYADAARAFDQSDDRQNRLTVELNQVQLWISTGRFDQARRQAEELLRIGKDDSPLWAGELFRHLGVIARERSDYSAAEENFEIAARAAAGWGDLLLTADVAEQRAEMYWAEHRHREMLSSLNQAFTIYSQLKAQRRVAQVERRNSALEQRFLKIAKRWGDSIEGKDHYTQGHCERVANLATRLAERAGLEARTMFWFRLGALLHDIGKIVVPTEVLNKSGPLTEDEWALMKKHTVVGFEMVAGIDFPGEVPSMIRSHHERWDGRGYPDGLQGEEIPLTARILCLADVYDALTTTRPYRPALSPARSVEIMRTSRTQFDPDLLTLFVELASSIPHQVEPAVNSVSHTGS